MLTRKLFACHLTRATKLVNLASNHIRTLKYCFRILNSWLSNYITRGENNDEKKYSKSYCLIAKPNFITISFIELDATDFLEGGGTYKMREEEIRDVVERKFTR